MTNENTKPVSTLKDGLLKAVIWKNAGDQGAYYSVQIIRIYRDEKTNEWRDTHSFSNGELLKVARLAEKAYDAIAGMRAEKGGQS